MVGIEEINDLIHRFGESVRSFFREQQRSSQISPMFNLPGRLILGSYCYYEHLSPLLRQVRERVDPEVLGARMKGLCTRPNEMNLSSLMLGYLNGRQQALLRGEARADDQEETADIIDFWFGATRAYRSDGKLFPEDSGFRLPILGEGLIEVLVTALKDDMTPTDRKKVRRAMATIELFTFILNGEARIGVFRHGPYSLANGDLLIVKEYVGLQDDVYSWSGEESLLPVPNIALVLRVRDVSVRFGLMGSLKTTPAEYEDRVVSQAVVTHQGNRVYQVPLEELEVISNCAGEAQMELYRQFLNWNGQRCVEYGAELYGNILRVFGDAAGMGRRFSEEIKERFEQSTSRHLESIMSGEPPVVLQHIAQTDGEIYQPVSD